MEIKTNINNLKNYKTYHKVQQAVEEFLQKKGYLKIHLPVLSPVLIPESYLEVFETEFKYFGKKQKLYLTPSPELFLKRLLTQGIGNCYYLGKAFRNGELNSSLHSFEFSMLEFYKVGVDYMGLAEEVLELLKFISMNCHSGKSRFNRDASRIVVKNNDSGQAGMTIKYRNKTISLEKWEKISVAEAFNKYSTINENELFDQKKFIKKAKEKGYNVNLVIPDLIRNPDKIDSRFRGNDNMTTYSYEDLFSQIFVNEIEKNLGKHGYPTLIYDYPKQLASLAKLNADGKTAQRCEFYIGSLEVGGFCTELNDFQEQEKRFNFETVKRKKNDLINHPIDKGFIETLKYGLPSCTGAGIGFDRLAMIFANATSIDQLKLINITS